ncbi:MAG: S1C family serine protease [Micrococcales bacterium]
MNQTPTNSHYNAQFLFETPAQTAASPAAFGARATRALRKSSITAGIVVGSVVGAVVGAGTGIGMLAFSGGEGTVIVNNTDSVNWVTGAAAKASPSVVTISVSSATSGGSGSGVVLTSSGYILTNTHVVTLDGTTGAPTIEVKTSDDRVYSARVIGTDPTNDLAVIKVNAVQKLTPIVFADSTKINVGDSVVAIGAPLGLDATVTSGIVSALNRTIQVDSSAAPSGKDGLGGLQFFNGSSTAAPINLNVIQTDAAINPGNSGGALVNDHGELLGINVAIASAGSTGGTQAGSIGVGFAIPSSNAKRIANEIIATGSASHAMLGALVSDSLSSKSDASFAVGALIQEVTKGSAAEKAGLRKGDIVTEFAGQKVQSASDLTALVRQQPAGAKVTLKVIRGAKTLTVSATLGDAVNLNK